jgi:hypothetical protein
MPLGTDGNSAKNTTVFKGEQGWNDQTSLLKGCGYDGNVSKQLSALAKKRDEVTASSRFSVFVPSGSQRVSSARDSDAISRLAVVGEPAHDVAALPDVGANSTRSGEAVSTRQRHRPR